MRTLICVLIVGAAFCCVAGADVANLGASHDASIYSNSLSNSNGAGPGMFAGTDGVPQNIRSLIQFDVAGNIPAGSTITGAQLNLTLGVVSGAAETGTRTIELHRLTSSWGEGVTGSTATQIGATGQGFAANAGDATWSSRFFSATTPVAWTTAGGDFVPAISASSDVGITTNVAYDWLTTPTLVADVQGWLDNPGSNDGWIMRNASETPTSRTFRAFYTREAATASIRPQLLVTYAAVPEPGCVAGIGVVALVLRRKR